PCALRWRRSNRNLARREGLVEMPNERKEVEAALKRDVIPLLRRSGFKGTFPHLRRGSPSAIDLLTFQFDKHGGGFVVEIARSPPDGVVTHWGEAIPPEKVKAWDVHPSRRKRVQMSAELGTDGWFRYDVNPIERVVAVVIERLGAEDLWD